MTSFSVLELDNDLLTLMEKPINYNRLLFLGEPMSYKRSNGLKIEEAYSEIKTILLERGSRIVSEDPPKYISIEHGSLHGVSPKSAKKVVSYHLFPYGLGTRIVSGSSVSSDWANLTLGGNIIAGFMAVLFWWIASDISNLLSYGEFGYWTWLARAFGYPDVQYTFFMINVTRVLSIVLVITIFLEILDVLIVYSKINTFAKETLDELAQK